MEPSSTRSLQPSNWRHATWPPWPREIAPDTGRALRLPDALALATASVLDASALLTTDAEWPATPVRVIDVGAGG